jgi:hypothetical protein
MGKGWEINDRGERPGEVRPILIDPGMDDELGMDLGVAEGAVRFESSIEPNPLGHEVVELFYFGLE